MTALWNLQFLQKFDFTLNQWRSFGVVTKFIYELLHMLSKLLLSLILSLLGLGLLIFRSNKVLIITSVLNKS